MVQPLADDLVVDAHGHVTAPAEAAVFQGNLVASRAQPVGHLKRRPSLSDDLLESALQSHLERLKGAGIDMQLISPRPFGMLHSLHPERVTQAWVGFVNDIIARHCELHPEVFRGVCGLPQFRDTSPTNCLEELERCVRELGFVGCLLNPDPMEGEGPPPPGLGHEFWYPLYEKLVELDVPAMVHSAAYSNEREPYTLHFINEETTAIFSLVESRVFEDFPTLRIIIPHGGGAIPYQMGRFRAWRVRAGLPSFDESIRKLWYDTCNYSQLSLELLLRVVGSDRVLLGTEMPGTGSAPDPETGRMLDDLRPVIENIDFLDDTDRKRVLRDNAVEVFKLTAGTATGGS